LNSPFLKAAPGSTSRTNQLDDAASLALVDRSRRSGGHRRRSFGDPCDTQRGRYKRRPSGARALPQRRGSRGKGGASRGPGRGDCRVAAACAVNTLSEGNFDELPEFWVRSEMWDTEGDPDGALRRSVWSEESGFDVLRRELEDGFAVSGADPAVSQEDAETPVGLFDIKDFALRELPAGIADVPDTAS
jgi:hypothetical protein